MSHDTQKADQIAFHFYTKLFYVVNDARATSDPRAPSKVDKWFNLETPEYSDLFTKEAREPYRSISTSPTPPPLEIQVLLTIPELTNNQVLVYLAPDSSRVRVEPTPRHILLEQWVLSLTPRDIYEEQDSEQIALPTIYKHGIPLFRSLYSLLRILPAWKVCKRLRPRGITNINRGGAGLTVQVRVRSGSFDDNVLGFASSPSPSHPPLPTSTHTFPSVPHPMGVFTLTATYLSNPNFRLDELESLLSSRFMSLDVGPEFTPTLVKNQQRDSLLSTGSASGSSPGSLPIRTSLPRSPPRDILRPSHYQHQRSRSRAEDADSIADRFVLPSRAASMSGGVSGISQRNSPVSLPITRATTTTSTTNPPSGLAARLRRESLGMGTGASASDSYLPSGAGQSALSSFPAASSSTAPQVFPSTSIPSSSSMPGSGSGLSLPSTSPMSMPSRRPGINPVHPFKSNTVADATSGSNPASSSGLGLNLGFGGGAGTGTPASPSSSSVRQNVAAGRISPLSSVGLPSLPNLSSVPRSGSGAPPSPIGLGMALGAAAGGGGVGGGSGGGSGGAGPSGGSSSGIGFTKPSPTFTPSSLGDRRSVVSAEGAISSGSVSSTSGVVAPGGGGEGPIPPRKRYSSSFGHRYSVAVGVGGGAGAAGVLPGGAGVSVGSEGSPRSHYGQMSSGGGGSAGQGSVRSIRSGGSGGAAAAAGAGAGTSPSAGSVGAERREKEGGSATFMNTNTDDDDISEFVQDIDTRKPLSGRSRIFASTHARKGSEGHERRRSGLAGASFGAGGDDDGDEGEANEGGSEGCRKGREGSQRLPMPEAVPMDREKTIRAREESKGGELPNFTHPDAPSKLSTAAVTEEAGIYSSSRDASRATRLPASGSGSGQVGAPSSPPMGSQAMLTSEAEVEAKLKRMKDTFLASLEGLGGGSSTRSRGVRTASGSGEGGSGAGRDSPSGSDRERTISLRGVGGRREGESSESSPVSPSRPRLLGGAEFGGGARERDYRERESWGGSLGSPASIGSFGTGGRGRGSGRGSPVPSPLYAQYSGRSRHGSTSTTVSEFISQSGQASGQGSEEVIGRLELGGGSGLGSS